MVSAEIADKTSQRRERLVQPPSLECALSNFKTAVDWRQESFEKQPRAGVAELVDAPDLKSGANGVRVRFPPPAP
jgi:hypothetical protein